MQMHSTHIFLFPFSWDYVTPEVKKNGINSEDIDARTDLSDFIKGLEFQEEAIKWKLQRFRGPSLTNKDYNEYTYFYDGVREVLFDEANEEQPFKHFTLQLNTLSAKYYIKVTTEKTYEYELDIESIELRAYESGVSALSFHLNNCKYSEKEDILRINDFGRRIYPQFLPLQRTKKNFLADELSIILNGKRILFEDFSSFSGESEGTKFENVHYISRTIMGLLGPKFKTVNNNTTEIGDIIVQPIIDDRMFTLCWYGNNELVSNGELTDNRDRKLTDNSKDFLYRFIFVDNDSKGISNNKMEEHLLENSIYSRWLNEGTVYGMSRYSFVLLTDKSEFALTLLRTHLSTIYFNMVCLALVQRASVLRFIKEAARVSRMLDNKNSSAGAKFKAKAARIWRMLYNRNSSAGAQFKVLQRQYIQFINRIWFTEVTAQEQGIEIYNILSEKMSVNRDLQFLDKAISDLHNFASLESSDRLQKVIGIFTVLAVGVSLSGLFFSLLDNQVQKIIGFIGNLTSDPGQSFGGFLWISFYISVINTIVYFLYKLLYKCLKN